MALQHVPDHLRLYDKEIVWQAVKQDGKASQYTSEFLLNDSDIVLDAVKTEARVLWHAGHVPRNNKEILLVCVKREGGLLQYASGSLKNDTDVVMAAVKEDGLSLEHAGYEAKNNKAIALQAVKQNGWALDCVGIQLQKDRDVILQALQQDCQALRCINREDDDDRSMTTFISTGLREFVLKAVRERGGMLFYATPQLKMDKEIVLAAVTNNPDAIKYAAGNLSRDKDCLIAAGMWDENHTDNGGNAQKQKQHEQVDIPLTSATPGLKRIALSTRFSIKPDSTFEATNFTKLFKNHEYIKNGGFVVYSPNAFDKSTCDPTGDYTNKHWVCTGTKETCQKPDHLKIGHPQDASCWRYSFRYHSQQAKESGGFMLQIVEAEDNSAKAKTQELGFGQEIEWYMALDVGTKIFRVFRPRNYGAKRHQEGFQGKFKEADIEKVVSAIQFWYNGGCADVGEPILRFPRGADMNEYWTG